MSRASNLTRKINTILEAKKKPTYTVGGFVRDPDGKMALEVNGKPYAYVDVYPDRDSGRDMVFITLHGQTLFVRPTGENSSITPEDMDKIREDVLAILYDKPTKYYGREQEDLIDTSLSIEPILTRGEKVILKKTLPDYVEMLKYIEGNVLENYHDLEDLGWEFPDPDHSLITEFVEDDKRVLFTWIPNGDAVKFQWAEIEDEACLLYVIQCQTKKIRKQGTLFDN